MIAFLSAEESLKNENDKPKMVFRSNLPKEKNGLPLPQKVKRNQSQDLNEVGAQHFVQ